MDGNVLLSREICIDLSLPLNRLLVTRILTCVNDNSFVIIKQLLKLDILVA